MAKHTENQFERDPAGMTSAARIAQFKAEVAKLEAAETDYEPFAAIIQQALAGRSGKGNLDRHPEHNAPRYVVVMCEILAQTIQSAGNTGVTVADIVRLESTCTGADYHQKLALRCHRLTLSAAA